MLQLLADQSFPDSIQLHALPGLRIGRWSNEFLSDVDMVQLAARENFHGLILLGTAGLYSGDMRAEATRLKITLLGTLEEDPIPAATAVGANLLSIERQVAPGVVLVVYAREVRPFAD